MLSSYSVFEPESRDLKCNGTLSALNGTYWKREENNIPTILFFFYSSTDMMNIFDPGRINKTYCTAISTFLPCFRRPCTFVHSFLSYKWGVRFSSNFSSYPFRSKLFIFFGGNLIRFPTNSFNTPNICEEQCFKKRTLENKATIKDSTWNRAHFHAFRITIFHLE